MGGIRKLKGMCGDIRLPVFSTKVENPGTSTFLVLYLGGEVISRNILKDSSTKGEKGYMCKGEKVGNFGNFKIFLPV